ncbi:hypothetical protein [uncultured Roseobacter sp.]|uniref:hypothetical protein n=1 Tax=uncultured Roseobacter sp. TaxID=114847 RepID=UPI00261BEC8F|nr:hypothetical protein [uncultured Roseobacter sp.]
MNAQTRIPFPAPDQPDGLSELLAALAGEPPEACAKTQMLPDDLLSRIDRLSGMALDTVLPRRFDLLSDGQLIAGLILGDSALLGFDREQSDAPAAALLRLLSTPGPLALTCCGRPAQGTNPSCSLSADQIARVPFDEITPGDLLHRTLTPLALSVTAWTSRTDNSKAPDDPELSTLARGFREDAPTLEPRGIVVPHKDQTAAFIYGTVTKGFALRAKKDAGLRALARWQQSAARSPSRP